MVILGLAVTLAAAGQIKADEQGNSSSLIQKLVEKFNLNKEEVQAVFNEEREERQAENQTRFENRLTQAVTDGKLTEEQKQKILAKHAELQAQMEAERQSAEGLTPEQRREAAKERHEALKTWAEENGIEVDWLEGRHQGKGPRGDPGRQPPCEENN